MSAPPFHAALHVLRVLDVGNAIDIVAAERALATRRLSRGPSMLRGALGAGAGGVRLATSPLDVDLGERTIGGRRAHVRVRFFEFGIASFRFRLELDVAPPELVPIAAEVEDDAGFDDEARSLWAELARGLGEAVKEPSPIDFVEDYSVFVVPLDPDEDAPDVVTRILLGEDDPRPLAAAQIAAVRDRRLAYFADDAVFVDFDAAVIVDPHGSAELVDIFEVATAHLLELRYYDALLSRVSHVIAQTAARTARASWLFRSPFERVEEDAARFFLEVAEMADRFERSITLQGDSFSVLVYAEAARCFRISEAAGAVHAKIELVARSAQVLGNQVHARRTLWLEVIVVVLIAVELAAALVHR